MKRFVEGVARGQSTLFPDRLEDWIGEDNPVRVIDVFVDELDLGGLGFDRVAPRAGPAWIGGNDRSELQEPAAHRFLEDVQVPLAKHLLNIMT